MVRIAIVDDEAVFADLASLLLRERGWDAFVCRSEDRAFPLLKQRRPDVILLDLQMQSRESGWSILNLLQLDPETAGIPVILCSADSQTLISQEDLLKDRGVRVLPKPFDVDDLYQRVEHALEDRRTGRPA